MSGKTKGTAAAAGALTGAGAGAAAGTAIMPGIGTAVGAIGGGLIGGLAGFFGAPDDVAPTPAINPGPTVGYGTDAAANDLSKYGLAGSRVGGEYAAGANDRSSKAFDMFAKGPTTFQADPRLAALEQSARNGDQRSALELDRMAAMGLAPSAAELQMHSGMDSALASQRSQAASARGQAGIALAGGNQAANSAALQANVIGQMGALRAQEMAQARGDYGAAAGQMRTQDQNLISISNTLGSNNAAGVNAYGTAAGNVGAAYGANGIGYMGNSDAFYNSAQNPLNTAYNGGVVQRGQNAGAAGLDAGFASAGALANKGANDQSGRNVVSAIGSAGNTAGNIIAANRQPAPAPGAPAVPAKLPYGQGGFNSQGVWVPGGGIGNT